MPLLMHFGRTYYDMPFNLIYERGVRQPLLPSWIRQKSILTYLLRITSSNRVGVLSVDLEMDYRRNKSQISICPNGLPGFMFAGWWTLKALITTFFFTHMYNGRRFNITSKVAVRRMGIASIIFRKVRRCTFCNLTAQMVVDPLYMDLQRVDLFPDCIYEHRFSPSLYNIFICSRQISNKIRTPFTGICASSRERTKYLFPFRHYLRRIWNSPDEACGRFFFIVVIMSSVIRTSCTSVECSVRKPSCWRSSKLRFWISSFNLSFAIPYVIFDREQRLMRLLFLSGTLMVLFSY